MAYFNNASAREAIIVQVASIIASQTGCTIEVRDVDIIFRGKRDNVRKACYDFRVVLESV